MEIYDIVKRHCQCVCKLQEVELVREVEVALEVDMVIEKLDFSSVRNVDHFARKEANQLVHDVAVLLAIGTER